MKKTPFDLLFLEAERRPPLPSEREKVAFFVAGSGQFPPLYRSREVLFSPITLALSLIKRGSYSKAEPTSGLHWSLRGGRESSPLFCGEDLRPFPLGAVRRKKNRKDSFFFLA